MKRKLGNDLRKKRKKCGVDKRRKTAAGKTFDASQVQMENSTTRGNCANNQSASSEPNLSQSELLVLDCLAGLVTIVAVVGFVVNLTVLLAFPKFDKFLIFVCSLQFCLQFFFFLIFVTMCMNEKI